MERAGIAGSPVCPRRHRLTVGTGVEYALPNSFLIRMEGVLDTYRAGRIVYDPLGNELRREDATTDGIGTLTLSVGARF